MKKIFLSIMTIASLFGATSCSDMLETDSDRQLIDPSINQKTDSIFYAFGVLQAVQQVADQYVFAGEMRGDLVKTSEYTDNNLRQLYNYTATATNKYDSAYVYYRIINNCNYYIAHRDTSLLTGSTAVVMPEYAAVKAFRAWAYLQLVRNYKSVPFFTEPLTTISQIEDSHFPELDLNGIVSKLAPDLEQYADMQVPTSGITNQGIGSTNFGESKSLTASKCYIPVALILGDLYLETAQYEKAADMYSRYLIKNELRQEFNPASPSIDQWQSLPASAIITSGSWTNSFTSNPIGDIITYIPMPVNSRQGVTTGVPNAFGFDYYAKRNETNLDEVQILPSASFRALSNSVDYYYNWGESRENVDTKKIGDTRYNNYMTQKYFTKDTTMWQMEKYNHGNIILYRKNVVYLRLAEALNRMGYPDAAFAILKDGISDRLLATGYSYITDKTRELLQTKLPFLSTLNRKNFSVSYLDKDNTSKSRSFGGVHSNGAGVTYDGLYPGSSPYQMDTIVVNKIKELSQKFPSVQVPATTDGTVAEIWSQLTPEEIQNAIEDLICDEYALESAYEGNRYYDLMRLARHKNASSPTAYGGNFGTQWLVNKLTTSDRDASILNDENKWYLPFN